MKKILTDVDGVLLDWETAFHAWMKAEGHVQTQTGIYAIHDMYDMVKDRAMAAVSDFNNSDAIEYLPAFRDAVEGVTALHNMGFVFDAITAFGTNPDAIQRRQSNLDAVFGAHVWDKLISTELTGTKDPELAAYAGTGYFWIDDKPSNCDVGVKHGLRVIIMDHPHNQWYDNPKVKRVSCWQDIVKYIKESSQHDSNTQLNVGAN